ncbi:ribonuclease HI [Fusobacterium necrophorum subsp. funduliforme]|uniref:ribonuclease H family protein n=1 Tax=Fusobacterium necrophorum TaxID=859 RepID=UPI000245DBA3|nr:ribonuclease H family protein [Fusobacterium necrophorum]AVQ21432.1 ribonuclease HI [Fusobacterium necrophorum subsp. funduliforme]EHO19676.1 hypothetical protein HMPREF9466_01607 [Fusobacterium necrophorum subsp. funduliforme 1_1_36S]
MNKKKFYAYFLEDERESGILNSWSECEKKVYKKRSKYKSFSNMQEAKQWLSDVMRASLSDVTNVDSISSNAIFFDAGTGRGIGAEVRVTNNLGDSLLTSNPKCNQFGNICLEFEKTNNFGELLGLFFAIEHAIANGIYQIYGDSNLVLQYWSKGIYHAEKLPQETIDMIHIVTEKRKFFENLGGKISYISGDINPADLGFHKR